MGGAKTGSCVESAKTIEDDEPGRAESKVDIVIREKQTDGNSEIYYAIHPSENRTPTTPDITNKTLIIISS